MKHDVKRNRILALLVLLGVLASLVPLAARARAEETDKTYDLLLSYNSLHAMAAQSELSDGEWMDLFRGWGVNKIILGETAIKKMSGNAAIPIFGGTVAEIRNSHAWQLRYPAPVAQWVEDAEDLQDALAIVEDVRYVDWVVNAIEQRLADADYRRYDEDGVTYLFFPRQSDGLPGALVLDMPIGVWPETAQLAAEHGLQVIPRTEAREKLNDEHFAAAFLDVLSESGSPYFLNMGEAILGDDSEAGKALLRDYLRETGLSVGVFEENDQSGNLDWDGFEYLLEQTGYHGVRLFNEWPYIQYRYAYCGYEGPEEITNSLFRAVAERNCRIVYLTMILEPDNDVSTDADENAWTYITNPADYEKMLGDLEARLGALGYTNGTVRAMDMKTPSLLWRVLEGIGVVAAAVLLLDLFCALSLRVRALLLGLGVLGVLALAFVKPATYQVVLSMGGGIVMPALAAVWLCRYAARRRREEPEPRLGSLLLQTVGALLCAALVSLGGAAMASSALSQMSYLLELDLYRGVKLMQLIPIGVFCLAYLLVYAYEESGAKAAVLARIGARGEKGRAAKLYAYGAELMDRPMKLGWMVALVLLAVAGLFVLVVGVYYIRRTGNTMSVSARELALRNLLENLLIARPRTKELLIGWPCTMLFVWSLRRHMNVLPLLFGGGMSIGLVSVVNTFLHIRTPLLLSLLRTGWGVLFGVALGVVVTLAAELLLRLLRRWGAALRTQ
ncbi:MAG: DUF5693 family protein [Oscillospiraceae bacterium]|nr:DUF5693 family protein [Oscillospiraceae bacterium]